MEGVPKSDIKSVIKSDIRFDISKKRTTWIGDRCLKNPHEICVAKKNEPRICEVLSS